MEQKPFYTSKTIWVNVIAMLAIILNALWGFEMDAEFQAAIATTILAVVNIVLRFTTTKPVEPPVQSIATLIGK